MKNEPKEKEERDLRAQMTAGSFHAPSTRALPRAYLSDLSDALEPIRPPATRLTAMTFCAAPTMLLRRGAFALRSSAACFAASAASSSSFSES